MKQLLKVKRLYLLFFLPLIVATTCEDDDLSSGFETNYVIQNDTSSDVIYLNQGNSQITIESESSYNLASELNQVTSPILPSESFRFSQIKIYKEVNNDFILVYQQDPIDDALWLYTETSENRYEYKLILNDNLVD